MGPLTCDHCLLLFPEREAVYEDIDGKRHVFCCNGCSTIYQLIHAEGLDDFYRKRKWDEAGIPAEAKKGVDPGQFVSLVREEDDRQEIDLYVDGIRCASCIWLNERILKSTPGVEAARLNFATHRARIRWDPGRVGLEQILKRIVSIGYLPKPYSESEQYRAQQAETRDLLVRFGTAGFLSSQLMIYSIALYAGYFQGMDPGMKRILEIIALLLTTPVIFYSGMPFIRNTVHGISHLHVTMDALIAIGSLSAYFYSICQMFMGGEVYFDTAAMIITLILLGRYIEATAKGRASEALRKLSELNPRKATVVKAAFGTEDISAAVTEAVPVSALKKGDIIKVVPGERLPIDGVVMQGTSEVDESLITGESRPVQKSPAKEVIGGSVNLFGTFFFEVTRTGAETVLAGIIRAVEEAQAKRPRIQMIADRIVGYFVPAIIGIAALTIFGYLFRGAALHTAVMTGISVLVIACPCSLGLATPLAILVFSTRASQKGVLVRSGDLVENAGRISHVIFDKTGTMTEGRPSLKKIIPVDMSLEAPYLLTLAASLESLSEHSIGYAITRACERSLFPVEAFTAIPGRGIEGRVEGRLVLLGNRTLTQQGGSGEMAADIAGTVHAFERQGDTVIFMAWDGRIRAVFVIADPLREKAGDVVRSLQNLGRKVFLLSGDNRATTGSISSSVGADNFYAEVSPEEKREVISGLRKRGARCMMVGDGINDAPALIEAEVGLAMGRGTDIALESADAVLMRNDLGLIPWLLRLTARASSVIKQNVFWAFFYNVVAIPLAVAGVLHPIIAAGAMAASSLFVVLNSLRIRKEISD